MITHTILCLEYIEDHPACTADELCAGTGIPFRVVASCLYELREAGSVHEGAPRGGKPTLYVHYGEAPRVMPAADIPFFVEAEAIADEFDAAIAAVAAIAYAPPEEIVRLPYVEPPRFPCLGGCGVMVAEGQKCPPCAGAAVDVFMARRRERLREASEKAAKAGYAKSKRADVRPRNKASRARKAKK